MRILLYIPKHEFNIDANKELVSTLNTCLNDRSITSIAASNIVHSDITHTVSRKMLDGITILHIFGCWNKEAAQIMAKATKLGIPTIFSPLGGLEPWTVKGKAVKRIIQKKLYQKRMTRQASAIHVAGKFENEMLCKLHWNNRVEIIKNPVLTSLVTHEETARLMTDLYQKVLDSNVYTLMSTQAVTALSYLLKASICQDMTKMTKNKEEAIDAIEKMEASDWRNICIYAHDEHITDIIAHGIHILTPNKTVTEVDDNKRFLNKNNYPEGNLRYDDVISKNIILKSKVEDIATDEEQTERELCMMVLNIKYEIAHNSLPLLHVANLATRLLNENYDEDILAAMLEATNATSFMGRLEGAMETILKLSEGYMPIKPINDKQTRELALRITKLKNIVKI